MVDERRFQLRVDGLAAQPLDDEVVVLDLHTSSYLLLNSTGATLWPVLQGGATLDALAAVLVTEFEIGHADALRDAASFVAELERLGLVTAGC